MADKEEIGWPYTHHPSLGVRLRTTFGQEYPLTDEELVMVDTGYSGEIAIPRRLYQMLGFHMWEEPEFQRFTVADGRDLQMRVSHGYILMPKLDRAPFSVEVHTWVKEERDFDEIIIGVKFIKRFKLLLDGPANKVRIL